MLFLTGHERVRTSKEHAGDFSYGAQGESSISRADLDDCQAGTPAAITSTQEIRQLPHHGGIRLRKRFAILVYG